MSRRTGGVAHFAKYHAMGNDYLVVDAQRSGLPATGESARLLCDRRFGVGADGVLFGPVGPVRPGEPVGLTAFNADGSGCGRSGNGIRIFALHLARSGLIPPETEITVRTFAGDSPVRVVDQAAGVVRIGMGRPSFDPRDIPVSGPSGSGAAWELDLDGEALAVTFVSIGTPHTVLFLDEPTEALARELGPRIAGHPRIPQRTNAELVHVVDSTLIRIEIWERGAGYTTASGAGGCAAAAAARALGRVGDRVTVRMPGGELEVRFNAEGGASIAGPVEQIAAGDLAPPFAARLGRAAAPHPLEGAVP